LLFIALSSLSFLPARAPSAAPLTHIDALDSEKGRAVTFYSSSAHSSFARGCMFVLCECVALYTDTISCFMGVDSNACIMQSAPGRINYKDDDGLDP
jgi:hypothetical protein